MTINSVSREAAKRKLVLLLPLLTAGAAWGQDQPDEPPPAPGKLQARLETGGHMGGIVRLFFVRGERQLVSVGRDNSIRFWDVKSGQPVRTLWFTAMINPESTTQTVAVSPDGHTLVLHGRPSQEAGQKRPFAFVNLVEGTLERTLEVEHTSKFLFGMALSRDGKRLAAGGNSGATVWNASTGKVLLENSKRGAYALSVEFSPDGKQVVILFGDNKLNPREIRPEVRVFDVAGARQITTFEPAARARTVRFSADGERIAVLGEDGFEEWDPKAGKRLFEKACGHTVAVTYAPNGAILTGGSLPGGKLARVETYGPQRGKGTVTYKGPTAEFASDVALSPNGRMVAAALEPEHTICIWDRTGGDPIATLHGRGRPFFGVGWAPNGKSLAFGRTPLPSAPDGPVRPTIDRAFNIATLRFDTRTDLKAARRAVLSSPDRGNLVLGEKPHVTKAGKEIVSFRLPPRAQASCGTFLPDGRVALGMRGGVIFLFDGKTGAQIERLHDHKAPVYDLAASPDGKYLLSASADQTLKVWSLAQPVPTKPLLSLFISRGDWVAWTPQGYFAATPNAESMVGWLRWSGVSELPMYFTAEQFRSVLYRPDVIQLVLEKGSVAEAVKAANAARVAQKIAVPRGVADPDKLLPPIVTFSVVDQKNLPTIKLKVTAKQAVPEQPVRSLKLLVDGRPLPSREGVESYPDGREQKEVATTWTVTLPPGKHKLSVLAKSKDDTPSFSNVIEIDAGVAQRGPVPKEQRAVLHHIGVGVNKYDRQGLTLNFAVADAKLLAEAFKEVSAHGVPYGVAKSTLLLDAAATRDAVLKALDDLRKGGAVKANDLLILSFAGHGKREDGEFFLLTREADPTSRETLEKTALSGAALRQKLADFPCQVLLMLDACHAGALPAARNGDPATAPSEEAARALADVDTRVTVMCAAMGHEEAQEKNGHGLFTAAIGRALKSGSKVFYDDETGELNVYHLQAYIYQEVARDSNFKQNPFLKMPFGTPPYPVKILPKVGGGNAR